ncbi:MAG: aspartate--tRNA ligase [Candidatus Liptonbacteria bacterium]|nr:aspartate--tRNA ligase [Candidatus Pacearchaeota archaeon]MBM3257027.1 aspartate--tRNA ligase [Candidatus Liptonbacteria bacterium]
MLRTHTCGELSGKDVGKKVQLCGWVQTVRAHGGVVFLDMRDRYGVVQVVLIKKSKGFEQAKSIALESCVKIVGEVVKRKAGTENKELSTGSIEVFCEAFEVLNPCPPLPFMLNDAEVNEDVKMKYRYLDLRSERMQRNLHLRGRIMQTIRSFFAKEGFTEFETPLLAKSTPEGARDYLVPSRVHAGKFYALPQSPQLFKQLLMVSGMDRYFQIARCLRDEDLRADRQPEFTQLDVEMSFVNEEDIYSSVEQLMKALFKEVLHQDLKTPFRRIPYAEAMKKYNSDKPDLRKETGEKYAFSWIVDFPLFEYSEEEKKYVAAHHPFCMPSDLTLLEKEPLKVKAKTYDLVLNGTELLSGSIRIHNPEIQKRVFKVLGIDEKEAEEKFGFLLHALSYGAPPHGGYAIGLDRFIQIIIGADTIRDVIAFPKNKAAQDVMLDTPSSVSEKQLKEVFIKLDVPKKEEKKKK